MTGSIESKNLEKWEVDLFKTKNHMLLGDLGEVIALHYLTNLGFFLVARAVRFDAKGEVVLISAHYQKQKHEYTYFLTEEQKEYLKNHLAWDYVAFKKECEPRPIKYGNKIFLKDWESPYLIEVKTFRGQKQFKKKPKTEQISKAKTAGFKILVVIVRLLNNWNLSVTAYKL